MKVPELHIRLDREHDLARQIYEQVRDAIRAGRLSRGDRLPPARELAERLDVSRNTITLAYEWLIAEGLAAGQMRSGYFVEGERDRPERTPRNAKIAHRREFDFPAPHVRIHAPKFDFGVGMPDARLFPYDVWRRLLARQIRAQRLDAVYGDAAGLPRLREAIARHIAASRGVETTADDIIVTNGAQHAFDLIARVLLTVGSRVAVEEPGYPPPRQLFATYGAKIHAVPVDADGLIVNKLTSERLVYVTPSHQFPLGMPMSHARRMELLTWAQKQNAVLIEDDYDSEFRFGGRPLETLQSLDGAGRVIYTGSFSKSLLPSLRLGFLVAPPSLRDALRAAAYVSGWYPQIPAQNALAAMIEEGLLARHIRRMRRVYAERHAKILATLERDFRGVLEPIPSVAGMHLAARLVRRKSDAFPAHDVGVDRLSAYCAKRKQPGLVLGYGAIDTSRIDEGLRRLRSLL